MGHKKQKPTRTPYMYSDPTTGQPLIASPNHSLPDRHFKPEDPAIASTLPVPPPYPFKPRSGVFKPVLDPESAELVSKLHESRERLKKRQLAKQAAEALEKAKEKLRLENPEEYEKQRAEEEQVKMRKAYRRVDVLKANDIPGERPSRRLQEKKAKEAEVLEPASRVHQPGRKARQAKKKEVGTNVNRLVHAGDDILPSIEEEPVEPIRRPEPDWSGVHQWLYHYERQDPKRPSTISMISVNQILEEEDRASATMANHNSEMHDSVREDPGADNNASVATTSDNLVPEPSSKQKSSEDANKVLSDSTTKANITGSITSEEVVPAQLQSKSISSDHQHSHFDLLNKDAVRRHNSMVERRDVRKEALKELAYGAQRWVQAKNFWNKIKTGKELKINLPRSKLGEESEADHIAPVAAASLEPVPQRLSQRRSLVKATEVLTEGPPKSDSGICETTSDRIPNPPTGEALNSSQQHPHIDHPDPRDLDFRKSTTSNHLRRLDEEKAMKLKRKLAKAPESSIKLNSDDGDDDLIYVKTKEPNADHKRVKLIVTAEDEYIDTRLSSVEASNEGGTEGVDDVIYISTRSVAIQDTVTNTNVLPTNENSTHYYFPPKKSRGTNTNILPTNENSTHYYFPPKKSRGGAQRRRDR
ncbi:uncharacterized protein AB675_10323 [Cyphellophora attinorum]|uniref:Uncharacterized protein n=1 Tax=Cyphellophora attinorum TaxID=1664694 RepID=A0A0N0NJX0_9EURO|nr:uncharacterized protein AB675_10323 [Phialophora attinorum]KPI37471.1 hypothetical protein AB675_10323 [Phialophora attinorum]